MLCTANFLAIARLLTSFHAIDQRFVFIFNTKIFSELGSSSGEFREGVSVRIVKGNVSETQWVVFWVFQVFVGHSFPSLGREFHIQFLQSTVILIYMFTHLLHPPWHSWSLVPPLRKAGSFSLCKSSSASHQQSRYCQKVLLTRQVCALAPRAAPEDPCSGLAGGTHFHGRD